VPLLFTMKPVLPGSVMVRFTVLPEVAPGAMLRDALAGLVAKVKVSVVALTVIDTEAVLDKLPEVPVTVKLVVAAAMLAEVSTVSTVDVGELAGLKLQVAPLGRPEQLKVTELLKPLAGATVMVVALLFCPAEALTEPLLAESEKLGMVASQAGKSVLASTDPRPLTRL